MFRVTSSPRIDDSLIQNAVPMRSKSAPSFDHLFNSPATTPPPDEQRLFSVLIIDDSNVSRAVIEKKFKEVFEKEKCAYLIETAENGDEGWIKCQEKVYTLYVVDHEMPGKSGVSICQELIKNGSHVVLYSASTLDNFRDLDFRVRVIGKKPTLLQEFLTDKVTVFMQQHFSGRKNSQNGEPE
jgi:CheY-like chemotaxis protein